MGDLLVVSGPPGAGKTALAAAIADRWDPSVLIEGDAFFGFLRRGAIAPWRPEADAQNAVVAAATGAAAGRFAAGPAMVVYDGVVGPWFLPTFLGHAGLVSCSYAVVLPPLEQCLHGIRTRVGHGFTDEGAARHMHAQFAGAAIEARHLFANPPGAFEQTVEAIVAAHAAGTLATLAV
ncbi:ATP-binding protein [Iamia sp. SCSIO 61187]|uniref:AAA family ATPase n=1 Tax=Iamia sp. SCSIO 61187 TaxID=2722752 RepID=UPI001C62AC15|nr:AAA family ATPase [Iamia sp. SCSIO 61187]QYG93095.1 ATP-binding protein [Iamia sp. SCSIO 61187]